MYLNYNYVGINMLSHLLHQSMTDRKLCLSVKMTDTKEIIFERLI